MQYLEIAPGWTQIAKAYKFLGTSTWVRIRYKTSVSYDINIVFIRSKLLLLTMDALLKLQFKLRIV